MARWTTVLRPRRVQKSEAGWRLKASSSGSRTPVPAVDGVSFTGARGEIFGLLGPNGAGKTTTIGVLTTRVRPDSGRAFVGGVDVINDPVAAKSRLAVVPQRNNLDRSLSIRQNLLFHAAYHGVAAAEREQRAPVLLEQFGLASRENDKVDMFSGGQTQRVMIARAPMHAPEVLFLDEPTTGKLARRSLADDRSARTSILVAYNRSNRSRTPSAA